MNQRFKRSLSVLTAILVFLCVLPFQAAAQGTPKSQYSERIDKKHPVSVAGAPETAMSEFEKSDWDTVQVSSEGKETESSNNLREIAYVSRKTENRGNEEIWDGSIAADYAGGSGTETDPYLISNGSELAYLSRQVNDGNLYENIYFQITADIYLNDITDWENWGMSTPGINVWSGAGNYSNAFSGNFDGNGYSVFGVYINKDASSDENSYQGLFRYNRGSIANLGVEASYIHGYDTVGGVVGYNGGIVSNCCNTGNIVSEGKYAGGIVGYNDVGQVTGCHNTGSVSGNKTTGGIVGHNVYSKISFSYNTGAVNCGGWYAGGVIGYNDKGSDINACYNTGEISASYNAGGIAGYVNEGIVAGCYNTGDVSSYYFVGGIAGWNRKTVSNCYNTGYVEGTQDVGGLVGYNNGNLLYSYNTGTVNGHTETGGLAGINWRYIISNCYNTGNVSGVNIVGGLTGKNVNQAIVTDCYNIGNVSGNSDTGGAVGLPEDGSITYCYYLDSCCAVSDPNGIALTDAQMQQAESFEDFDFDFVWTMEGKPDYHYPELEPEFEITFIDELTDEIIPGSYSVLAGTILNEEDFPEPPVHEGCEFLGWNYTGLPIYQDTAIRAKYYDPNAIMLNCYFGFNPAASSSVWGEFPYYDPSEIKYHCEMPNTVAAAYAGGKVYGFLHDYDAEGKPDARFYIMDSETYEVTYPGYNPALDVTAMAYNHAEGVMYALVALSYDERALYKVNLAIGVLEYVADIHAHGETIMTFAIDGEGNAYGLNSDPNINGSASLWSIDLTTGVCNFIGKTGLSLEYTQAMTWDHNTDRLYWAQYYDATDNGLYIVDPATGAVTPCGKIGRGAEVSNLWIANDEPVAPIEAPEFQITFIDGLTGEEIPGVYTVEAGEILNAEDFPVPPDHEAEGYEFTGWDYNGEAIYIDTVVTAIYRSVNEIGFYFETDPAAEGWTWMDQDGDGYDWCWVYDNPKLGAPEGLGMMNSESFNEEIGPLTPDNWLISPVIPGGGSVSFMYMGYCMENFGVYVSADGGETWSDELGYYTTPGTEEAQTTEVNLSAYAGRDIQIAFRHYNSDEGFILFIDAVVVTSGGGSEPTPEEPPVSPAVGFYFETEPEGWTSQDRDGDGYNWFWCYGAGDPFHIIPEGFGMMSSESYVTWYGSIFPDNWLISPVISGGGYVKFLYVSQDVFFSTENIGVYVTADGGNTWSDELGYFTSAGEVQTGIVTLSQFAGQDIQIAFRHYNSTGQFIVSLDAVEVFGSDAPIPPTMPPTEPPTESPTEPPTESPTEPPTESPAPPVLGYYFESDPTELWNWEDADGDGYNWQWMFNNGFNVPEGLGFMNSQSYVNYVGALTPDNWLVSPIISDATSVSFMFMGQDPAYASEVIGVYVSTDGGNTWSDELGYFTATGAVQTKTVDLSQFEGQALQVAFRHYDVTDQFSVNLDAVEFENGVFTAPAPEPGSPTEPPTEEPPTEEPPTEEPPTEEPPTEEPPTEEPPTEEPPTEEPPTEEPPTEEPPTEEPPTEEPPTEEPPTEEPPTEEPPTEEPPTEEPPTEEPPTEEPTAPPAPPVTGFVSLAGIGIAAILAGAGIVLLRRKKS